MSNHFIYPVRPFGVIGPVRFANEIGCRCYKLSWIVSLSYVFSLAIIGGYYRQSVPFLLLFGVTVVLAILIRLTLLTVRNSDGERSGSLAGGNGEAHHFP